MTKKKKRVELLEVQPGGFHVAGFAVLSSAMFQFACEMSRQSTVTRFLPKMSYPMAAVIHSAASLEAFLNEELEKIITTWGADWESTIESLERLDVPKKWIVFPKLLHGDTFNTGAEPYQSFCGLIELRNALMHYRPIATAEPYIPKEVAALKSKFEFDRHPYMDWTSRVLTPSCARWACRTAHAMVREYFSLSGRAEFWPVAEEMSWKLNLDETKSA